MRKRLTLSVKGFLMGAADVIPGVSGGTVALIVGIYHDLVFSIQSIGPAFVKAVFGADLWRAIAARFRTSDRAARPEQLARDESCEPAVWRAEVVLFLCFLVAGILAAVLTMVKVIPLLLDLYPEATSGFFFGLVLASAAVPLRMVKKLTPGCYASLALAAVLTFMLMGLKVETSAMGRGEVTVRRADASATLVLPATSRFTTAAEVADAKHGTFARPLAPVQLGPGEREKKVQVVATRAGADTNFAAGTLQAAYPAVAGVTVEQSAALEGGRDTPLWYVFVAGAIAICAMILPGVSGSFLLLMLGQYGYIVNRVHGLVHAQDMSVLPTILVFLAGITTGILLFSRVLHQLLRRAHDLTMAALTGLMLGSLRKIWPFRSTDGVEQHNVLPAQIDSTVMLTAACFVVGFALIVALQVAARRKTVV